MEADPVLFRDSETGAGQRNRVSAVIGIIDDDVLVQPSGASSKVPASR
jgi:hypothetical protein